MNQNSFYVDLLRRSGNIWFGFELTCFQDFSETTWGVLGAMCWTNLQPMQVVPPDGVIWN